MILWDNFDTLYFPFSLIFGFSTFLREKLLIKNIHVICDILLYFLNICIIYLIFVLNKEAKAARMAYGSPPVHSTLSLSKSSAEAKAARMAYGSPPPCIQLWVWACLSIGMVWTRILLAVWFFKLAPNVTLRRKYRESNLRPYGRACARREGALSTRPPRCWFYVFTELLVDYFQ